MSTAMSGAPAPRRLVAVDALVLVLSGLLAVQPLGDAFGTGRWLVAAAAGLALGIGLTLLARRLRWGPFLSVLVLVVGYLLVGPAVAAPDQAVAGVLPGPDAERTLVTGVVEAWRSVLTLPVPLGQSRGELVVPLLIALIGSALAAVLLWRSRWPHTVALAVIAMYVVAAAFGTRDAQWPIVRGALLVVLLLTWIRARDLRHLKVSWGRRIGLGLAVLGVSGAVAWGAAALVPADHPREVLRDHVEPPLKELDFKSPLAAYRSYYKKHKNDVLFRLDDLPAGDPCVRLATMDTFDGVVWNVSTTDRQTGSSAFGPAPDATSGDAITVTVGEYGGPWLPVVGRGVGASRVKDQASGADRELLVNPASGALADYGGARSGDVYRIAWAPGAGCANDARATTVDRSQAVVPMDFAIESVDELTAQWTAAGGTSDYDRVVAVEQGFQTGYFNDGLDPTKYDYSRSGHGAKRLADLTVDPGRMVGNDEQYASAMAYAVQRLGMPARVVLGFESVRQDGTVTGDDIAAWVEVPFEGHGWMRFDPTPSEERTPPPLNDSPNPVPQPYVVQPPVLPQEPADVQGVPPEGSGQDLSDQVWDVLWLILGYLWLAARIVLVLSPLWGVLLLKRLRRRWRMRAADPVDRLSGGWRELTDRARDLGVRLSPGSTRQESGVLLTGRFGAAEPGALAIVADRHVFGPGQPTDDDVAAYWADVETAIKRMRRSSPRWRRMLAGFSPASMPWAAARARASAGARRLGDRARAAGRRLLRRPRAVQTQGQHDSAGGGE